MILAQRAKPDVHTALEEILHAASHGLGAVLALIALVLLVAKAAVVGGPKEIFAVSIFAISRVSALPLLDNLPQRLSVPFPALSGDI